MLEPCAFWTQRISFVFLLETFFSQKVLKPTHGNCILDKILPITKIIMLESVHSNSIHFTELAAPLKKNILG